MRKILTKKTSFIISLILVFQLTSAFSCNSSGSKVRQLAKVNDDLGQGLLSTAEILRDSKATGVLSQDDIDFLKPILKTIGETNLSVITIGKSLNSLEDIPIGKQEQILQAISFASDQLTLLNNEGALRIKNQEKRLLFNAIVLAMQTSVTSVIRILNLGVKK